MNKVKQVISTLFLCCAITISAHAVDNTALATKLDNHIQHYVQQEDFQGSVFIAQAGQVLLKQAYGYADREQRLANRIDTQFLIGSLTKSFTATLVLKLAEQGKLDLSQPISRYLPGLTTPWSKQLTLHHLLKHQTGLPVHLVRVVTFKESDVSSAEILQIINTTQVHFAAGSQYQYSNLGYQLAALAIEKVTGKSYRKKLCASFTGIYFYPA